MVGNTEKTRLFTRRALLLGGAKVGLFSTLLGRLYYLQVISGNEYHKMAEDNRINVRVIPPQRGQIFDRFGAPLALNDQTFRVVLLPEQVDKLRPLLEKLGTHIRMDEADMKRVEKDFRERNKFNAIIVRDNLSRDQMDTIAVHTPELMGIDIDAGEVRSYPYSESTAHILGYVGIASKNERDDPENIHVFSVPGFRVGKSGVERQYEREMRGKVGNVEMEVNAHGRVVRELVRHNPVAGDDLTLSIDIGLQQFIQRRVQKEGSASVVVMNIKTGEILAMVSHPSFDPNSFTFGISRKEWDVLNKDMRAPLLNKAVNGVYAPGSTFKPIPALAALEAGVITPTTRIHCPGYYELGGRKFRCWKKDGHGSVNMAEALAVSCDTYFYEIGLRAGIDKIQAMAQRFGLGQRVGIDLPHEKTGFVPSRAWKKSTRRQDWLQGETLISSIGQGFLLTSPLQLAVLAARLADSGPSIKPHIVKKVGNQEREIKRGSSLGVNPKHLEVIQEGLLAVVNAPFGTAHNIKTDEEDFQIAGKTGSAQVRHINEAEHQSGVIKNEDLPWRERDHALFIGYAPAHAPRYAISVVVEHGGSGAHNAAPIARDVLKECQARNL